MPDTDHDSRFYPRNGSRIYEIIAELPLGLKCRNCVLQWKYVAGNNWGMCDSEHGAVGCGPQEEFRACSDIQIGDGFLKPQLYPVPSTTKSNQTNNHSPNIKVTTPLSTENKEGSIFITFQIIFLTLILVLFFLAVMYLYHYHGQQIKDILRWKQDKDSSSAKRISTFRIERPPVPPPRVKRVSLITEMTSDSNVS